MAIPQDRIKRPAPVARGRQAEPQRRRRRLPLIIGAIVGLAVIVGGLLFYLNRDIPAVVTSVPVTVLPTRNHVQDGTAVQYNSSPPTSGDHWAVPAQWGVYNQAPVDEKLVHNLEHGGVIISYDPAQLNQRTIDRIKSLTRSLNGQQQVCTLSTPRANMTAGQPIALTSWGVLSTLDRFDEQAIRKFWTDHHAQGPEFGPGVCG